MIKLYFSTVIKLYFSTVKILAQRPIHISAVATVLLITKTVIVKHYSRRERGWRKKQIDKQTEKQPKT